MLQVGQAGRQPQPIVWGGGGQCDVSVAASGGAAWRDAAGGAGLEAVCLLPVLLTTPLGLRAVLHAVLQLPALCLMLTRFCEHFHCLTLSSNPARISGVALACMPCPWCMPPHQARSSSLAVPDWGCGPVVQRLCLQVLWPGHRAHCRAALPYAWCRSTRLARSQSTAVRRVMLWAWLSTSLAPASRCSWLG
jgi:hypothetical protein